MNAGVFGGLGEARKGDAAEIIRSVPADVVYLDPPYPGTTGYEKAYAVLDALLGDERSPSLAPALDELLDAAAAAPLVLLSYGGPTVTLEQEAKRTDDEARLQTLRDMFERHAREGLLLQQKGAEWLAPMSAVVPRTQFVVLRIHTSRQRCTPPLGVTQVPELIHEGRADGATGGARVQPNYLP